jgi:hypothetical protein
MVTTLEKPEISLAEEMAAADPCVWAAQSAIRLANGELFSFKNRPYLIQPMRSDHKQICVMKAAQLGFSETFILRELHACIYGIYRQGALYLFPNADEMRKFSQSRFNTLISANKSVLGKYVKSGSKGGTDTANLKRVGNANLFLDGATLTQNIGENVQQKESAALRGKSVDSIDCDEYDLMDSGILTNAGSRLKNSDIARLTILSNPSIPDYGVSKLYNQSCQNMWFRKCSCGHWNCPDLVFPDYIGIKDDGVGYCACQKCGKPLPLGIYSPDPESPQYKNHSCEWRPQKPENKEWEGYSISTLNHPRTDPYQTLKLFKEAKDIGGVKLTNFYKFELGLPYIDSSDQLTPSVVYDCCGHDTMLPSHTGPCAMGVDVGLTWHVVIGIRIDRDRWEILKVGRCGSIDDVHTLARMFNVKSSVIDIRPYEDTVRRFQKEYRGKTYLCEYTQNPMEEAFWDNNRNVVKTYRTGILDATHRVISDKKIKLPRRCPEIDEFARQCCNTAKVLEESKRTGSPVYNYIKLGDDHYRHALGYFYLAASGTKISVVKSLYSENKELQFVTNETERYI